MASRVRMTEVFEVAGDPIVNQTRQVLAAMTEALTSLGELFETHLADAEAHRSRLSLVRRQEDLIRDLRAELEQVKAAHREGRGVV